MKNSTACEKHGNDTHFTKAWSGTLMSSKSFAFCSPDFSVSEAKSKLDFLRESFRKIYQGGASTLRFEELYRNAYLLVINKHGEMLYEAVQVWIKEKLSSVHKTVSQTQNDNLLPVLIQVSLVHFFCV
jgi:hypothetical protein